MSASPSTWVKAADGRREVTRAAAEMTSIATAVTGAVAEATYLAPEVTWGVSVGELRGGRGDMFGC